MGIYLFFRKSLSGFQSKKLFLQTNHNAKNKTNLCCSLFPETVFKVSGNCLKDNGINIMWKKREFDSSLSSIQFTKYKLMLGVYQNNMDLTIT